MVVIELCCNAGIKGHGKREIPVKTRLPAASSDTIPTCENPAVTRPGIEAGSTGVTKGRGKREIPEKTRRPVVSSGTIPTCENAGVTRRRFNTVLLCGRRAGEPLNH
ncbi:hypothetical protein PR048_013640 [Dryococelus australis]|uniref:Uncharacterized protein n=1 Tax=Dryococelus australis TaxID=614101 RepID=A0ABQ9HTJ4_9NEOP|nr:hypothetical protein PR048_013640 [Dryococelus australis]